MAQPVEIDPALEIDRDVAVRGDRPIPAPIRFEMLGADQVRRKRVRNIHGDTRLEGAAIDCNKAFRDAKGACQGCCTNVGHMVRDAPFALRATAGSSP